MPSSANQRSLFLSSTLLRGLISFVVLASMVGCKTITPSNHRNWSPEQALIPAAHFEKNKVTVENVRQCSYVTEHDFVANFETREYDLAKLKTVDFIVVPFKDAPSIAHTMLSFGFEDDEYVIISVEIRKEQGEKYGALKGFFRQYELMYVVADERDVLQRNTVYRDDDVYLYRTKATPTQARLMFVDMLQRANKLVEEPEFYDTITNNCTTNIVQHINRLSPSRVPYDVRVLLPGYSDQLAYDIGLLETKTTYDSARQKARINELAVRYQDDADFSAKIRRR